jgi:hypothetical protein
MAADSVMLSLQKDTADTTLPDTTYHYLTNTQGIVSFSNIPIQITNTTGITSVTSPEVRIYPASGSDLNFFLKKYEQGTIKIIDMNGRIVKQQTFNGNHGYLRLTGLSPGMYIYNIKTNNEEKTGKYLKTNQPPKGASQRPTQNFNKPISFKNTLEKYAKYQVQIRNKEFHSKDTIIELYQTNDTINFLINPLAKITDDTTFATGLIQMRDGKTNQVMKNINLTIRPDSIGKVSLDTIYHLIANYGLPFKIPSHIDSIIDENAKAKYWVKWENKKYHTDSTLINIKGGDNGFVNFLMKPITIPHTQDFMITIKDDSLRPIKDTKIIFYSPSIDTLINGKTDKNGHYQILNAPEGSKWIFSLGKDNYYAFNNVTYIVPTIKTAQDTINDYFRAVLFKKDSAISTADHIAIMAASGTIDNDSTTTSTRIKRFYLGKTLDEIEINAWLNSINEYMKEINIKFIETKDKDSANIIINDGTYATNTNGRTLFNPLGIRFSPIFIAYVTGNGADNAKNIHELARALGFSETGYQGTMNASPIPPTPDDIAVQNIILDHYIRLVYTLHESELDLFNIRDSLSLDKNTSFNLRGTNQENKNLKVINQTTRNTNNTGKAK